MDFISLTNYELHREHIRTLRLKMSIFEKSYPEMVGKSCREILKLPIKRSERETAAFLLADILAHEMYFESFSSPNLVSPRIRETYGSEANFIYLLSRTAEVGEGFLFVTTDRQGAPSFAVHRSPLTAFLSQESPVLAVDLCEHAYFYDYFFDKPTYIKAALAHLDLSKIK